MLLGLGLLLLLGLGLSARTGWMERQELALLDLRFQVRAQLRGGVGPRTSGADLADPGGRALAAAPGPLVGRPGRGDREAPGHGVAAVGLDYRHLARLARDPRLVVAAFVDPATGGFRPPASFLGLTADPLSGMGIVNLRLDPDGVARRFPLYTTDRDGVSHLAMSLQLARRLAPLTLEDGGAAVRLPDGRAVAGPLLVNYGRFAFPTCSFGTALDADEASSRDCAGGWCSWAPPTRRRTTPTPRPPRPAARAWPSWPRPRTRWPPAGRWSRRIRAGTGCCSGWPWPGPWRRRSGWPGAPGSWPAPGWGRPCWPARPGPSARRG